MNHRTKRLRDQVLAALDLEQVFELLGITSVQERPGADEYTITCPFHDDDKPSMSVNKGTHDPSKRGVFNCHACDSHGSVFDLVGRMLLLTFTDALDELARLCGLPPVDARPEISETLVKKWHRALKDAPKIRRYLRKTRGLSKDIVDEFELGYDGERITIPVRDYQGRLRNVRRYLPYAPRPPKIISYAQNGSGYGENRMFNPAAVVSGEQIIICEGEFDCLLLLSQGFNACTSTTGAGKFHVDWVPWFVGKRVFIVPDRDGPGQRGAVKIANMLARVARVSIVQLPNEVGDGGDVTDFFVKLRRSPEDFEELLDASPDLDADATEPEPIARSMRELLADPTALEAPEPLIPRLAWRGRVTLFAAPDKSGKSTFVSAACAAATRGDAFLDGQTARSRVLWLMLEEHAGDLLTRAVRFETDPDQLWVLAPTPDLDTAVAKAIDALAPDLLVVDTLVRYAETRITQSGDAGQWAQVMRNFLDIAHERNVAVVILHHARKQDGRARDSSDITAAADVIIEQTIRQGDANGVQRFAVRGRWSLDDFKVRLDSALDRYAITDEDDSDLGTRILDFVKNNQDATATAIRRGVQARYKDVANELDRLVGRQELVRHRVGSATRFTLAGRVEVVP